MNGELKDKLSVITEEEQSILNGANIPRPEYFSGRSNIVESMRVSHGKLMDIRVHTRFADFPEHSHNYIEIVYMFSGSTTHIINGGKEIVLKQGEFLMLNQHASHRIKRAAENDIAVNIIILPKFFDMALELTGRDNILASFLVNGLKIKDEGVSFLHFKAAENTAVQKNTEALILNFLEGNADTRILRLSLGLVLLQLLGNAATLDIKENSGSMQQVTTQVLSLIETDYRTVALEEIAKKNGVTAAYVSKAVKKITGKTFKEILIEKRISKAKELLEATSLSVQDICVAVGYDNTSHFYRLFFAGTGMSPSNYRRLKRDAE